MKIKEMLEDSRPRERLVKFGVQNLSDSELLALILEKGTREENVIEMSNRLISKYGLDKLSDCSLKELQEIKGIGFAKACQIMALFEFNKRYNMSKNPIKKITCAKDVFDLFHERLKDEKQENFIVLLLNNKNHVLGDFLVAKGTLDASIIHPREVFKPAIKNSASKIILVHNHPSGEAEPSGEDIEVTKKLIEAGKSLGIQVLDHVIVGGEKWWSQLEK
jgi:DNA repair protein RadC